MHFGVSLLATLTIASSEILIDTASYNQTMKWGTYRPNLYFGMRSRETKTLMSGILWHDLRSLESKPWENIRHACDQNENVEFLWNQHDGKTFGVQTIKDRSNNAELTIKFVKLANTDGHLTDFAVRISGKPLDQSKGCKF